MRRSCAVLGSSSEAWLARQHRDPFVTRATEEGWRSRAVFKLSEIDKRFRLFTRNRSVLDLGCAPGGWTQYAVTRTIPAADRQLMPSPVVPTKSGDNPSQQQQQSNDRIRTQQQPQRKNKKKRVGVWEVAAASTPADASTSLPPLSSSSPPSSPPSSPSSRQAPDHALRQRPSGGSPVVVGVDLSRIIPIPGATLVEGDFTTPPVQSTVRRLLPGGQADVLLSDMAHNFTGNATADALLQMELAGVAAAFARHSLRRGGSMVLKLRICGQEMAFLRDVQTWFRSADLYKPEASRSDSAETFLVAQGRK